MNSIYFTGDTQRPITSDAWLTLTQNYRSVIFDCDGTLVNSSDAHFAAFQSAVQEQGFTMSHDWYATRTGLDRFSTFADFTKTAQGTLDIPRAAQDSINAFIANADAVTAIPQTETLVQSLRGKTPMAVGTNSEIDVATASLTATGLIDAFIHIVTVSDGLPPKPASDIFQTAAARLGTLPAHTLVFEDSNEGVRGALNAGFDVIQLIHG